MAHTPNRIVFVITLLIAGFGSLCAQAQEQMTPELWVADVDSLAENLLTKHPNFYSKHTVEEFEDAVELLIEKIPLLDDAQIVMELNRIIAMGGDSHTNLKFNSYTQTMHKLPIQCIVLSDGVYISAATAPNRDLIGSQILKFGETDAHDAFERISVLFGYENNSRVINAGSSYITLLPALSAVGLADDSNANTFELTIKDIEGEHTVTLDCTIPETRPQWMSFAQSFENGMPLMYRKSSGNYQTEFLKESGVMYLAYNKCQDAKDFPMELLIKFIAEKSEEFDARRIVIDLRFNGGGDETVFWPMIDSLKDSTRFNEKGDIITLISRYTFSSAMSNAHQLKDRAGATLIGEPTGGKPNHFGQLGSFILPNSKLTVSHSTRWFQKVEGDPDAVHPDILIEVGSGDFFAGNDPVLQAALSYIAD